jgi:hypothetical protein
MYILHHVNATTRLRSPKGFSVRGGWGWHSVNIDRKTTTKLKAPCAHTQTHTHTHTSAQRNMSGNVHPQYKQEVPFVAIEIISEMESCDCQKPHTVASSLVQKIYIYYKTEEVKYVMWKP